MGAMASCAIPLIRIVCGIPDLQAAVHYMQSTPKILPQISSLTNWNDRHLHSPEKWPQYSTLRVLSSNP